MVVVAVSAVVVVVVVVGWPFDGDGHGAFILARW